MKKILAILLAVSALAFVMSGCGEKAAEGDAAKPAETGTTTGGDAGK